MRRTVVRRLLGAWGAREMERRHTKDEPPPFAAIYWRRWKRRYVQLRKPEGGPTVTSRRAWKRLAARRERRRELQKEREHPRFWDRPLDGIRRA